MLEVNITPGYGNYFYLKGGGGRTMKVLLEMKMEHYVTYYKKICVRSSLFNIFPRCVFVLTQGSNSGAD
jgi:hypothetical protein